MVAREVPRHPFVMSPPPSVNDGDSAAASPSGSVSGPHSAAPVVRRTLPPPEWLDHEGPRSAASLALERFELDAPVARRSGPRAELAGLRARLAATTTREDPESEHAAAVALARALATRGTELEFATKLSRRALLMGDDPALREELAGWFATMGEPALAAATLLPMADARSGAERATLLVRVAVLQARAGEAHAALEALELAQTAHAADPVPSELLASLSAWAPDIVSRERASEAFLAASERREAMGDRSAAFENLIRAFEATAAHAPAAEKLATVLEQRGRRGARDEVRREHGKALGAAGRAVHVRRMRIALREDDVAGALGAAFDARLDAEIDLRSVLGAIDPIDGADDTAHVGLDGLLARTGLQELLAARVELACDFLAGRERARARIALGRLYAETLARPDRAVDAWMDAVISDPGNEEAKDSLRRYAAATRDFTPLVEALVRVGQTGAQTNRTEREGCLKELLTLAEQRLDDPSLALWAAKRLSAGATEEPEVREAALRLAPRVRAQDEELALHRAALEQASGVERIEPLTRLLRILGGRPDAAEMQLSLLRELSKLLPDDRSHQLAAERLLAREGKLEELEASLQHAATRAQSALDRARARLALASAKRRRGDQEGAQRELSPLLDELGAHAAAWSMSLLLAAQRGDGPVRARSLLRLAATLLPAPRATLTAVAAEWLLEAGDVDRARIAAEQACNADPSLARAVAVRAAVGFRTRDRWGADAMERAMGAVVPRAAMCAALADAYDLLGEPLLATAWSQRRGALLPGDLNAASDRLARAVRAADGAKLADTLAWLLSQPQPLEQLAIDIARALETLAELAPGRASALARRALDVLGARHDRLRSTVLQLADKVGERGLGIAALERFIATGAFEGSRALLLLDLARRRRAAGDADGSARALLRAIREGAPPHEIMAELDAALPTRSSDGELALLEARAETLSALAEADRAGTARAWRELGGALYDLAGDRDAALRAWERAVSLDSESGVENFAADVVSFIGFDAALERLRDLAARQTQPQQAARCLGVAASVALGSGRRRDAFDVAVGALGLDPSRTDVLAVAERAAADDQIDALEHVYDKLADVSLGCYGERAVHYRAARQLERRGDSLRALRHAVQAFEAVPSEGIVFVTMARLADRSGERSEVVRAIERVALANNNADARAAWLRRAALFTGSSEEGRRQRVDVLLRALSVRAEADLVRSLSKAMFELIESAADEREILELRFERAVTELLRKVDGPEGARIGIEVALGAMNTFRSPRLALAALQRAVQSDGDIEEFAILFEHAAALAAAETAAEFVQQIVKLTGNRFAQVGPQLLELAGRLAERRGDLVSQTELLVQAACKKPEDLPLVRRAEAAAQKLGDPRLLEMVLGAVPLRDRLGALLELATAAERSSNLEQAIDALGRALAIEEISSEERAPIIERALALCERADLAERLESLAESSIADTSLPLELRVRAARALGLRLAGRNEHDRALEHWRTLLRSAPDDFELLDAAADVAEKAFDNDFRAKLLGHRIELMKPSPERLLKVRALARLLEQVGDRTAALPHWQALAAADPRDVESLSALERDAERRGDYEALAASLGRRAALAPLVEEVRRLRLRRASVLDQQLGRADEARMELEALLAATGDNQPVLLNLAALHERLGDPLRAAPLWMRASALAAERSEAADCARRACEGYLSGGDVDAAARVLEGMEAWAGQERLLELSVKIERQRGRPKVLAEALDELATSSDASADQRAAWLVEAARASLAAGDEAAAKRRALRACELVPELADAQLLARWLEYLERGAGSREQARETVAELRAVGQRLAAQDAELRAFLVAEALDVAAPGSGAGLRELEKARAELGALPLLALGQAERMAASGVMERALEAFDVALSGDLRRVRRRERVAVRAAEAARVAGERDRAEAYFEIAMADAETRAAAEAGLRAIHEEREAELARPSRQPPEPGPEISIELTDSSPEFGEPPEPPPESASARSATISSLTPAPEGVLPRVTPAPRPELGGVDALPVPQVPSAAPLPATVSGAPRPQEAGRYTAQERRVEEVVALRSRVPSAPSRPPTRSVSSALETPLPGVTPLEAPPPPNVEDASASPGRYSVRPERAERARSSQPPPPPEPLPPVSLPAASLPTDRLSMTFVAVSGDEATLHLALRNGSVEAGRELMQQLRNRTDRTHDLVSVCRRVATLRPGDIDVLKDLHRAARLDRDHAHVAALEHLLSLVLPNSFTAPPLPALAELPEQPDMVRTMLFREVHSPVLEALSLVWEGAEHVFKRDTSAYGLTGLERIPLTAPTPLARVYSGAARALGMPKTPLFQRRSAGPVTVNLALLSPPAIVLSGEVREESAELRFHLGAMLAAALPQFVLLFGAPESQARSVLRGLSFAFGPPRPTPASLGPVLTLAELLWESIPARLQRRLRELCDNPEALDYDAALQQARMAVRRAGLFVAGDFHCALREICADERLDAGRVTTPSGLFELCKESPSLGSLYGLAVSPEYAETRWRSSRTRQTTGSFGT